MKVFLISGKARHGKDTTGNFLQEAYEQKGYKVCRSQISKYLKVYVKDYFGWDGAEETKPRKLLQELGTDVIREKLNKERFFIDRTFEDIEILSYFFDIMIITDIRLPIEITAINEKIKDVVSINIERVNFESPLTGSEQKHKIENGMDDFKDYDYQLINDTLDKLKNSAYQIAEREVIK